MNDSKIPGIPAELDAVQPDTPDMPRRIRFKRKSTKKKKPKVVR